MLKYSCLSSAARNVPYSVVCVVPNRFCSQDIRILKNPETASLKRGTGGRSSFNGNVVTVFGATGFLGRFICNHLGKRGSQMIIPYRCDSDDWFLKSLKVSGDLGQVVYQPFNLKDPLSIRKAIKYSNVVINLIGAHYETKNFDMYDVNATGAAEIAKACREMNVERLIHFSALNVTDHPQRHVYKTSKFYPTKLQGERAVLEEFPEATIFRPGSMCGLGDSFLWPILSSNRGHNKKPLYAAGKKTTKMPVYAGDVANGVMAAIENYNTRGQIYQGIGPERYFLDDIVYFCSQITQKKGSKSEIISDLRYNIIFPLTVIFQNNVLGYFLYKPRWNLNFDLIERESTTDVVDGSLPTLTDLGVSLQKFEDYVPSLIINKFSFAKKAAVRLRDMVVADSLSGKAVNVFK